MRENKFIPAPRAQGWIQLVKKSLAEFRVRRRESIIICFLPRHVRGRKHFARSERRIVRYQRTTEAQNAAKLSRKSGKATFSTVSQRGRECSRPRFRCNIQLHLFTAVRRAGAVLFLRRGYARAVLFENRLCKQRPQQHHHRRHERKGVQPPHAQPRKLRRH